MIKKGYEYFGSIETWQFIFAVFCMGVIVVGSNFLVQFPLNDWLTWGALSYPLSFLLTDLLNRRFGPKIARRVVGMGFIIAVIVSMWTASIRIALASGCAYLCAQLLDISIFNCLRNQNWWRAPLISGTFATIIDTILFFSIAFAMSGLPWMTWAIGDLLIKLAVNACMLAPFRALMWNLAKPV